MKKTKKFKKVLVAILCFSLIANNFISSFAENNDGETTIIEESTTVEETTNNTLYESEYDENITEGKNTDVENNINDYDLEQENDEEKVDITKIKKENDIENNDEVATESDADFENEIEESIENIVEDEATPSELEETKIEKCNVVVYYLTDMKLKDKGNGGSYNYSWDTFLVDKNQEFNIDKKIPEIIKHSSCEQEYTLVGFTTENQKDTLWKGADYAGGVSILDKNFIVDNDMEIFAVYEAKDTYISSIIIDNEVTYKTTTIPNKAIKNIFISSNNDDIYTKDENVKYYKIKNNLDSINYMFTKDSSEGKPIKVEGFSLEQYKK